MKHFREDYNRIQDMHGLIPVDEPVLLLRGQDMFAAQTVRFHAQLLEQGGADTPIVKALRECAEAMDNWHIKKVPDMKD
jgi:hypothetical protein